MAGSSVGSIQLDLGINKSGFNSDLNGIKKTANSAASSLTKTFGKIAKAAAAAFSIKAIASFAKSCIDLGSDLSEVQNVVDVTFGDMSGKVNDFAQNAMTSFGLSEKVAKQYMGTFGAMSKAFGYTTDAAYEQAAALTGLAGDVASFYNLTTDEAYTKLKSVFTGETESLKDLGVVMTQTALDDFALQQGMGKTTANMSEQEKVALRLAFVQDKLAAASGDFARTSNSWANQTKVLSLRFDALKASIGQGLINVLTPVIRMINDLVAWLQVAADAFRDFTAAIFGDAGGTSTADSMSEASADLATNTESAAGSAAAIKKSLAGFDKVNILSDSSSSDGSGGTGSGSVNTSGATEAGSSEAAANSAIGALENLKQKLQEIANWTGLDKLWEGIKKGIDKIDFDAIKKNFKSSFNSLKPIAKSALSGVGTISRSWTNYIGTILGGIASIAGKEIEIASGGLATFLENEKGNISLWIQETSGKIATGFNNLSFSAENIFGSFWSALDTNEMEIELSVSNFLSSFSNAGMTIGTIFSDLWLGLTEGIAEFTEENKPLLDDFFNGIIETSTNMSNTVTGVFDDIFNSLSTWWEEDGKRIWDEIVGVFNNLTEWVLRIWNEFVKPIVDKLCKEFDRLWKEHLKPLWDNILGFITSVWDFVKMLWDKCLKPVVDWIIDNVVPNIKNAINIIISIISTVIGIVVDVVSGVIKAVKGLLDFITGVFTGDWEKAWGGIKDFFGGIWDAIWGICKGVVNLIIDGINLLWTGIYSAVKGIVNALGSIAGAIGDLFGQDWHFSMPADPPLIPKLATGGYVAANTPQLAIIGDNKHEGEIVAPESKIAEAVATGVSAAFRQYAQFMGATSNKQPIYLTVKLGEDDFWSGFVDYHNSIVKRTGDSPLLV